MTQRDQGDSEWAPTSGANCPRCRQPVELRAGGRIKPHRDELTYEPCPTEGLTPAQAQKWIANLRAELEDRVRESLRPPA